jgi:hypothetical protein
MHLTSDAKLLFSAFELLEVGGVIAGDNSLQAGLFFQPRLKTSMPGSSSIA